MHPQFHPSQIEQEVSTGLSELDLHRVARSGRLKRRHESAATQTTTVKKSGINAIRDSGNRSSTAVSPQVL